MPITNKTIMNIMEKLCPAKLAYEWDNVGLIIGEEDKEVKKILIALDATEDVIEEAIANNCNLIITHHPIIFKSIKNITTTTATGKKIIKAIQNNISVFCAHTNLDIANGGTNDTLANMLQLTNIKILKNTHEEKLCKIVTYVPQQHAEKVRTAICNAGAGNIGNYSDCTFNTNGIGTFLPKDNANPFIGKRGEKETVSEIKIETIVSETKVNNVIAALKEAHPYEEVAYDIYNVEQKGIQYGIGRIGKLNTSMALEEFVIFVKNTLNLKHINIVGTKNTIIKKVALCTGSGSEYIKTAAMQGADVYITGDIKYHEAQSAQEFGICLIDATHYSSENIITEIVAKYIREKIDTKEIEIITSKLNGQPFTIV